MKTIRAIFRIIALLAALLFPQMASAAEFVPKTENRVGAIDLIAETSLKATSLCAGETRSVEAEFAAEVASRRTIRARGGAGRGVVERWQRNRAASSIRRFRTDMRASGMEGAFINSYVRAFDLQSFRYGRNLNPFKRFYRHYNLGGRVGGPWLHDSQRLLSASPAVRKQVLALPSSSAANGTAFTRIPFGRKVVAGTTAPQPSSFTGLPPGTATGGPPQRFVPGRPYPVFTVVP